MIRWKWSDKKPLPGATNTRERGPFGRDATTTLGEWAAQWLEIYKKGKVEDGTYRNYAHYVNKHIVPALGHLKFEDIRPAHIEKFMRGKSTLSASAQQHIKRALGAIFETAIDNGFCLSNPCRKITVKKDKDNAPKVFSKDDIAALLEIAPTVEYGYLLELLLYTGMRIGEAAGLQWRDIDRKEGIITIRHSVARKDGGGYYLKTTKSGKERYIGINAKLAALLDRRCAGCMCWPAQNLNLKASMYWKSTTR